MYILQKAQALFAQKGYLSTSMAEIAHASEFAVGSLYSFFNSKEEILATIFKEHIEQSLVKNQMIMDDATLSAKEKIEASLDTLVHTYVDQQDFSGFMSPRRGEWNGECGPRSGSTLPREARCISRAWRC